MFGKARRNLGRHMCSLARVHGADHAQQFILRHAFKEVRRSACSQRSFNFAITVRGCQHDDASLGKLPSNRYQCVGAIGTREPEIHQCNVWPMTSKFCDCLNCIGCLGDEKHVLFRTDDRAEACTKNRMVLNSQDTNLGGGAHRNSLFREIVTIFAAATKGSDWAGRSCSGPPTPIILIPSSPKKGTPYTLEECRPRTTAFEVVINTCLIHAAGVGQENTLLHADAQASPMSPGSLHLCRAFVGLL